jgi:hypothetical protein
MNAQSARHVHGSARKRGRNDAGQAESTVMEEQDDITPPATNRPNQSERPDANAPIQTAQDLIAVEW